MGLEPMIFRFTGGGCNPTQLGPPLITLSIWLWPPPFKHSQLNNSLALVNSGTNECSFGRVLRRSSISSTVTLHLNETIPNPKSSLAIYDLTKPLSPSSSKASLIFAFIPCPSFYTNLERPEGIEPSLHGLETRRHTKCIWTQLTSVII